MGSWVHDEGERHYAHSTLGMVASMAVYLALFVFAAAFGFAVAATFVLGLSEWVDLGVLPDFVAVTIGALAGMPIWVYSGIGVVYAFEWCLENTSARVPDWLRH
jgi:hypothetical protein